LSRNVAMALMSTVLSSLHQPGSFPSQHNVSSGD
jgi:hypothetical protein